MSNRDLIDQSENNSQRSLIIEQSGYESGGSDGLFKSNASKQKKKEKKVKTTNQERYTTIFQIYLKSFLGRRLSEYEDSFLLAYLTESTQKKVKLSSNHFEFTNEFDYSMGDIVIAFPNPDDQDIEKIEDMTPLEAIEYCLGCFCSKSGGNDFEMMDELIFMKAVEQAFLLLKKHNTQHSQNTEGAQKEEKQQDQDQSNNGQDQNQDSKHSNDMSKQQIQIQHIEELEIPRKSSSHKRGSSYGSNLKSQQSESYLDESMQINKLIQQPGARIMRSQGESDVVSVRTAGIDEKLSEAKKTPKPLRATAYKEVFNLDYAHLKQRNQDKVMMQGGGYLKFDFHAKLWKRTNLDTQDFATLIRNIALLQLTKIGFLYRLFISSDGNTIFCVLYQCDDNLKAVAEKHNITKQLNFYFSDLLSLEPVDKNLRPLRINNRLWKPQDYDKDKNPLSDTFKYLRPKIRLLLKQINIKRIARETNLSQLNQQILNEGTTDILHDENGPTDEEWTAYYSYLLFLNEKVQEIRQEFQLENQKCLEINGQLKPLKLALQKYSKDDRESLNQHIKGEELEQIQLMNKVDQIDQTINFDKRDPKIKEIYIDVFNQYKDWRRIQSKFSSIKSILHVPTHKNVTSKQIKVCYRERLAYHYYQAFKDALGVTNFAKPLVRTMWDEIGIVPFEPFIPYTITPTRQAFSQRNRLNSIWKKYCVTETGKISLFSGMERLKINTLLLNEEINFSMLFTKNLTISMFCLNDYYELFGKSQKEFFNPLFARNLDPKSFINYNQYFYFYKQFKNIAQQGTKVGPIMNQESEYQFVEPKPKDLAYQWRFQIQIPWNVPEEAIRNYYGEKIALYFIFLGYYTKMLLPLGILGLGVNIWQIMIWDNYSQWYIYPQMLFGFIQIQWCNLLFDLWQQKEKIFAIKYGQSEQGGVDSGQERSDFKGEYERSVVNDNMNTLSYPDLKKFMKILLTVIIQILLLMVYVGLIIGIFFISEVLTVEDSILKLNVTIPAVINLIVILILDEFYDILALRLTDYENHKTIQDYETNFVFKKYFLCFVSLCGPVLQIQFNHERVGLHCTNNDCFRHAQYYFSTIFLIQFSLNIWEIVKPKLLVFYKQYQQRKEIERDMAEMKQAEAQEQAGNLPSNLNSNEEIELDEVINSSGNPFQKINKFIENEFINKESYVISPERYGTVDDYMEILLQYSMLCLFGMQFPMCFAIAFIWNALELQTDKIKLIEMMQRPLPLSEASIGVWNGVLEGMAYLSLLSNSGTIAYSRERISGLDMGLSTLGFFLSVLLINFFLRFAEVSIFGDVSFEVKELVRRHNYLIKSTVEKFRGSTEKTAGTTDQKQKLKRYLIHKIYGTLLVKSEEQQYEEVSSDSDVDDYIVQRGPEQHKKQQQIARKVNEKIAEVQRFLANRVSNWALAFRMPEPKADIVIKANQKQEQKEAFLKILEFLKMIATLNTHHYTWTDDRFTFRYFYLRRSLVLLRNLDWRRMLIYRENQKAMKVELKEVQLHKYRQKLELIEMNKDSEQSQAEKDEIFQKIEKYIQKHLWVDGRKCITFKMQGVWFGQYRKRSKKVESLKIFDSYKRLVGKYKSLVRSEKQNAEIIPLDEQFTSMLCMMTEKQLLNFSDKKFLKLIDKIEIDRRQNFLYNLTTKGISLQNKELEPYIIVELKRQLNVLSFSYCPFRIQAPFVNYTTDFAWELFTEEQLQKQQPSFHILYPLDKKKLLSSASLEFNVFGVKPYLQRWLCSQSRDATLFSTLLLYHTEVGYHRLIHRDLINRVARFHRKLLDPMNSEIDFNMPIATLQYFHIQKANQLLNIRDPLIKGYMTRVYAPPRNSGFCNGKTLKDSLGGRQHFYDDHEMCDFIGSTIQTLEYVESEMGMYHGNINLNSFALIQKGSNYQYCMVEFGTFFWYDFKNERTHFTRALESNDELWYLSPELLANYLNPSRQVALCPQRCDVYSLGIVCLQLLTLGKMSTQIETSLKEYEGDVERAVKRWVVNNRQELSAKYPNSMQLILQLIHPDQKQRLLPSTMLPKVPGKSPLKETQIKIKFEEDLDHIISMSLYPNITQERMVRIFDGKQSELQSRIQDRILLSEYLKQQTFKLQLYMRIQQYEIMTLEMSEFEENLLKQYFFQLPYAKETGDVLWCIENYSFNQVYDIIEGNLNEFKYILHYMLLKAQLLIVKQDFKQCFKFLIKGLEVVKIIEQQSSHLSKECLKQENDSERNEEQTLHLTVMDQQQLGELQFQKDYLIKRMKQDQSLFKLIKKQPVRLKQYSKFLNQLLMTLYLVQEQSQQAMEVGEEIVIESLAEIRYDLKRIKKRTYEGKQIVKENIVYKMVQRFQYNYKRLVAAFDACKDHDFKVGIHDYLSEMLDMNAYIINEQDSLNPEKQSKIISEFFQGRVLKLREDFRKNVEQTLQFYYLQGKFLMIQFLHRVKDWKNIKNRLQIFNKHLINEECLIELSYRIPQLGWVTEVFAEFNEEDKCNSLFDTISEIMDEQFFIIENFHPITDIYVNFNKFLLSLIIQHCSQSVYYVPYSLSMGIYQGFCQLISQERIFSQSALLEKVLMIKVLQLLIQVQQNAQPIYLQQSEEQQVQFDVHDEIQDYSLILDLNQQFNTIYPYLNDETTKKLEVTWLRNNCLYPLQCELIQIYQYSTSNQHFENAENNDMTSNKQYSKTLDYKLYQLYLKYNKNDFVKIEHLLLRGRTLLLQANFSQIPQIIKEIIECFMAINQEFIIQSESQHCLKLALLSFLDLLLNYGYLRKIRYKQLIESEEFLWIMNSQYFDFRLFLIKLLDFYIKIQQIDMAQEIVKFILILYDKQSKLAMKQLPKSFQLTLQIFRVKLFQLSEDLRINVDKYDKKDSTQIEEIFQLVCQSHASIKKNSQLFEVSKLLLSQSLEQGEMDEIKQAFLDADINSLSLQNQLIICQLGVKLIIYLIHTGQFKEADNTCYNVDNKLFALIYTKLQQAALRWQSEKIFAKSNQTEISVNQLFRIIKLQQQGFEKYEHNVLIQFEPLKELLLNVREFKILKQLIQFRGLYSYLQCLHTLAQINKGDFRTAQQNLPFIEKFSEFKLEEVQILINNILMMFENSSGEFTKSQERTKLLLKQIQNKQFIQNIQISSDDSHYVQYILIIYQTYKNLEFEKIIAFENDQEILEPTHSLENTLIIEALKPYFDIPKLNTEAYLSFLEAAINLPDQLTSAVEQVFETQKYIQQQYGLQHMFNAHILRLIATMYAEFLINNRLKDLEKELTKNSEEKIKQFQKDLKQKTIKYLEARVKNQCTKQMEIKFKETSLFLKSQINVLKDITKGISQDIVCRWSLNAANESYNVYQIFAQEYQYEYNPYLGYLFIAYSDVYFVQNKLVSIINYLNKVKDVFEYCYTQISNPDYCRLYYKQGCLRQNIQSMLKIYLENLIGLANLNPNDKLHVLVQMLKENLEYLTHFDSYKSHGFDLFLELRIKQQIKVDYENGKKRLEAKRNDEKDLLQKIQVKSDQIKFQKDVDPKAKVPQHVIEDMLKDGIALLGRDKIKFDYSGEELFQKAYSICRLLFKPDNPLYIRLEDQIAKSKGKSKKR